MLFQATERTVRERTVLSDIGRAVTSEMEPSAILSSVDESLSQLIRYDHLGVVLTNEDNNTGTIVYWSKACLGERSVGDRITFDPTEVSLDDVVRDGGEDAIAAGIILSVDTESNRTWLHAPLVVHDRLIGLLLLSSDLDEAFDREESALALNVSLQIAPAIQNANLNASLKRVANEQRAIAAIGLAANQELMLDAIYNRVAEELSQVVQFDRLAITFVDPETNAHRIEFVSGVEVEGFQVGDVLESLGIDDRHIISSRDEWDSVSGEAVKLRDSSQLASRMLSLLGTRSAMLGVIVVTSNIPSAYDQRSADFLDRVANQITPAIRNARTLAAERELRETLDRQNQELFEANNARKMFLSTVSHELKTPLTIISGFIDLLGATDMDESERLETLAIVRRNANQLDVLINDILDISRMDAGTFKLNPAPFHVNELLQDLDASFQSFIGVKAQTIDVFIPDDEIWLDADRARIAQVVTNLLSNASKYSPEKTVIQLKCEVDGDRLHVAVTDQGIGISEEAQEQLFTAFFRVDNESTRKVSGTGLGLVIAKSIVELHGGEIRLTSRVGDGTTIEFWLPGLTTKESAEPHSETEVFTGSRLWADTPYETLAKDEDVELDLGA